MISLLNLTMATLAQVLTLGSPCVAQGDFPFHPYIVSTNLIDNIGEDGRFHFVYKTVCKVNGKYYIGKHSTDNLNDGYLGSGILLKNALKKYGKDQFDREIICFCRDEQEVYAKEHEIVTQEVVNDPMSYNLRQGGEGSQKIYSEEEAKEHMKESDKKYYQTHKDRYRETAQKYYQSNKEYFRKHQRAWRLKHQEYNREYLRAWRAKKKLEKENSNG